MADSGAESPQPAPWGSSAYFIWLAPSPAYAEADALSELLKSLQEQTGTPVFSPHVTLYRALPSQVSQTAIVDALTSALTLWRSVPQAQPLRLSFVDVAATSKYFQSLFALVHKQTEPLKTLWTALDQTFSGYLSESSSGVRAWDAYMPHLSLIYATEDTVSPEQKADITKQLEDAQLLQKDDSGMLLNGVRDLTAKALDVVLVRSRGPVDTWEMVHRTPLLP